MVGSLSRSAAAAPTGGTDDAESAHGSAAIREPSGLQGGAHAFAPSCCAEAFRFPGNLVSGPSQATEQ